MKISNSLTCTFIKHFSALLPISSHPNFFPDLENSDKLILPESIFITIRKSHHPLPPVFVLRSTKSSSIYTICGVYEFTASENCVYCPNWMLKKFTKRSKYCSSEALLELLHSKKTNTHPFPLLKKIEVLLNPSISAELCKKRLSLYTVLSKNETVTVFDSNHQPVSVHITNLLPKNKCLVKSTNFVLTVMQETVSSGSEEEFDIRPMIESLPFSLLVKKKVQERKCQSYTPWEHRVQPVRIEGETGDLMPWGREDVFQQEVMTQTLPDIQVGLRRSPRPVQLRQRKVLTLAFPMLSVPDKRPLTSLEVDVKYRSVSNSPVALRGHYHKNSVC